MGELSIIEYRFQLETGGRVEHCKGQVRTGNKRVGELRIAQDRFELETRGWEG